MSDKAQPKGSDSVVVIGLGRFGANVAEALVQLGHDVLARLARRRLLQPEPWRLVMETPND